MYKGENYIHGTFCRMHQDAIFEAVNPSTEETYGVFPVTQPEDIHEAVDLARKTQYYWKQESRVNRADLFDKLAQLIKRDLPKLRDAISVETGKNLNESHAEVVEALHMCQVAAAMGRQPYGEVYASELPTKDAYVVRKPRGVVAVISPWNFPLAIGGFCVLLLLSWRATLLFTNLQSLHQWSTRWSPNSTTRRVSLRVSLISFTEMALPEPPSSAAR